jgi:hypothetical protein
MFIAKYDANGNIIWAKTAGGKNVDEPFSISVNALGNVFVNGVFISSAITFGSITLPQTSGSGFIVEYDESGEVICASALLGGGSENTTSADHFGNLYIGGSFYIDPFIIGTDTLTLTNTVDNTGDAFIAKYNCNSNFIVNTSRPQSEEIITIFPNPSSGLFTLTTPTPSTRISIYDILGNCLLHKDYRNTTSPQFDLSSQGKGVYFVEVIANEKREVKKIVLN